MHVMFAPMLLLGIATLCMACSSCWEICTLNGCYLYKSRPLFSGIPYLISVCAYLLMTLNSYRYALLNEGGKQWWTLHLNGRFVKLVVYNFFYLLITVGIGVGAAILFFPSTITTTFMGLIVTGSLGLILGIACGIVVIFSVPYILLRLSLYPLFIAIDQPMPFRASWVLLKGNIWRFIGLSLLLALFMCGVSGLLNLCLWMLLSWHADYVPFLFIANVLIIVPTVSAVVFGKGFSLVYQTLGKKKRHR